jgi:ABC-type transport system involved in multi-copper enzyme maturation permease subunit
MISRTMLQLLTDGLFYGCLLFVPAFAANAIVIEKEQSTYDFLKTSLIRPSGIILSKLLNAVTFFILLLVGVVPVLGVVFFLVGIDAFDVLQALGFVIVTAASCAAVGLLSSALFRKSFAAIAGGYLGVAALMLGPLLVGFILVSTMALVADVRSVSGEMELIWASVSPIGALRYATYGQGSAPLVINAIIQLVFIIGCLSLTLRIIGRPERTPRIEQHKPIDSVEILEQRRKSFPWYLIDPQRRKKSIEDGRNPMMVREMRWGLMNRSGTSVRVFYCAFILYFFVGAMAWMSRSAYAMRDWILFQNYVTVLLAPALMANALTKEMELGNLDMLRMTLLRPRDIILGKLAAGALALTPVLAAALVSCIPVMLLGVDAGGVLAMGYGTLFICGFVSLSIGLLASLMARRTTTALVISYVFGVAAFGGVAFGMEWFSAIGQDPLPQSFTRFFSPITAFIQSTDFISRFDALKAYEYWFANAVASAMLSLSLIGLSVYGFNRYKMTDR